MENKDIQIQLSTSNLNIVLFHIINIHIVGKYPVGSLKLTIKPGQINLTGLIYYYIDFITVFRCNVLLRRVTEKIF